MTDDEIIKDLECHNDGCRCSLCSYKDYGLDCLHKLTIEVLDLINRKNAEIERLNAENKIYKDVNILIAYQRNKRDKEIQALHRQLHGLNFMEQQIKSEAIKEFAHFVIDRSRNGVIYTSDIPDLVKEMTEIETNQRKEDEGK